MEAGLVDLPPPELLPHGIGANSLHWRYQLSGLAGRFRLIAWNAPGYLLSDSLRAETPSCRDYADVLDDLLSARGIDGFDIVADSFSTRVAHCFAYRRPGRIGAHGVHRHQHRSQYVVRGAHAECRGTSAHDRTR